MSADPQNAETWRLWGRLAALAHDAVNRAFRDGVRESDPTLYDTLLHDLRAKTATALPSSDRQFQMNLAAGRPRYIETAIAFLEADPWFFRSGYEKQVLIRHLKRVQLAVAHKERLAGIVMAAIDGRDRVEFRHYCRLACYGWSDQLDAEVAERMRSADAGVRRRAQWVVEAVISSGKA